MSAAATLECTDVDDRPGAMNESWCVFDTTIGPCGLAWSAAGITRLRLPERDAATLVGRLASVTGAADAAAPSPTIAAAISLLRDYFLGRAVSLDGIGVDLSRVTPFHRQVYEALRKVRRGTTTTYGALARAVGEPGAARAIGQAMGRNPVPVIVPCHRVTASGGKPGGFSAPGGIVTKERLLVLEGASLGPAAPLLALMHRTGDH